MMMLGSMWVFFLLILPLVLLPSISAAVHRPKLSDRMSEMMRNWGDPKFKKVKVSAEASRKFCGSDDVAPRYDSPCIRKEYHTLADDERKMFHDCLLKMKNDPYTSTSGVSEYDMYVYYHRNVSAPGAHGGPAFLGFHREFCHRFEQSLRNCNPKVCLPYWDSSLDSYLPDASQSAVFSDSYLGTSFGVVTTGFMAHWGVVPEDCQETGREVTRECGNDGSLLMSDDKLDRFLQIKSFADAVTPYDSTFEADHGDVHAYVGGTMMSLNCACNDPIFFLHHSNIDYCNEKFRQLHPGSDDPKGYPDDLEVPPYHRKGDAMRPFYEKKNVDGLSNDYTKNFYSYEDSPKKCDDDTQCRSKILWCDKLRKRCKAKVMEKGECTGFPNEACFCPGQTPQCVVLGDVGMCKCSGESQAESSAPSCAAAKDCQADEWCDRKSGLCQKKVPMNGDCTGMPSAACSGRCKLPKQISCVSGTCKCTLLRCKNNDDECVSTSHWCNTVRKQCDRKLSIGEQCHGFPDNACKNTCQEYEEPKCQDTCQCVSK